MPDIARRGLLIGSLTAIGSLAAATNAHYFAFVNGLFSTWFGMVVLVGVALSPASAAVFSTLRTMSRVVIQLLASVFAVISPEISATI